MTVASYAGEAGPASAAPPRSGTGLLALRNGAQSLESFYNVRSEHFEAMLHDLDSIAHRLAERSEQLIAELHKAVPAAPDAVARRLLLRAKRAAYRGHAIDDQCLVCIDDGPMRDRASEYNALLVTRERRIADGVSVVMRQLRDGLAILAADPQFQTAVDYSCPSLFPRYRNGHGLTEREFTQAERGVYSYAVKFFSKANPFHTFASITLPSPEVSNETGDAYCEIVLDVSIILAIEERLLRENIDDSRRLLFFAPHTEDGERYRFLVSDGPRPRGMTLKASPLLRRALSFCSLSAPCRSLAACVDELVGAFPEVGRASAADYLHRLIDEGIVVEYLVRDFDNFQEDLAPEDEATRHAVVMLQSLHLARVMPSELPRIHENLRLAGDPAGKAPSYYVNLYRPRPAGREQRLADALADDLTAMKPFFSAEHNCTQRNRVIREFLADRAGQRSTGVPFLTILQDFLRAPLAAISRSSGATEPGPARSMSAAFRRRLQGLTGVLQRADVAALAEALPAQAEQRLCFNGPIDCGDGRFFPTNVFPGGGRYLSRYLLRGGALADAAEISDSGVIDAQLAGPFKANRTYVKSVFSTGCGFDARYRERFKHWIDPSDIVVRQDREQISYLHWPSGRQIRFHFCGFLLAEYLGPEYQLLLADHADFFYNPFALDAFPALRVERVEHTDGLYFGKICLRREQWMVPSRQIASALDGHDIVRATLQLREWIHEQTGSECDHWYYRAYSEARAVVRPRYLDLRNPLSAQVLRREVRSSGMTGRIVLERMEPRATGLFRDNGGTFVTEAMIEV